MNRLSGTLQSMLFIFLCISMHAMEKKQWHIALNHAIKTSKLYKVEILFNNPEEYGFTQIPKISQNKQKVLLQHAQDCINARHAESVVKQQQSRPTKYAFGVLCLSCALFKTMHMLPKKEEEGNAFDYSIIPLLGMTGAWYLVTVFQDEEAFALKNAQCIHNFLQQKFTPQQ